MFAGVLLLAVVSHLIDSDTNDNDDDNAVVEAVAAAAAGSGPPQTAVLDAQLG